MKYSLIALDVDGTLVRPDQTVAPETIAAIHDARDAGLRVCIATGRSLVETLPVWRQLRLTGAVEPMVLIGGALAAEPDTGRTLYQRTIPSDLACEYSQALKGRGYSAMAIVDAWRHGFDYYVVEAGDIASVRSGWFSKMNAKIHAVPSLAANGQAEVLRINAVAEPSAADELTADLAARFEGRLNIHRMLAPNYGVTVVEAFGLTTSKWTAIQYLAQGMWLGAGQIVAVGDDVNDLPMIRAAGLGVAMPWAPPHVKAAAKAIAEPDLAQFIRSLLN